MKLSDWLSQSKVPCLLFIKLELDELILKLRCTIDIVIRCFNFEKM